MLINRRRLRVVTAAAMLTACAGTQANEVPGYGFALYEQRETRGMHHPRSLDLQEEMMVQGLTDKLLAS